MILDLFRPGRHGAFLVRSPIPARWGDAFIRAVVPCEGSTPWTAAVECLAAMLLDQALERGVGWESDPTLWDTALMLRIRAWLMLDDAVASGALCCIPAPHPPRTRRRRLLPWRRGNADAGCKCRQRNDPTASPEHQRV